VLSSASSCPPHPPATESRRALYHYQRAIAALRSEPYRDMPPALRADLLSRLRRERDALLQQMGYAEFPMPLNSLVVPR
jgi:predicted metal-binding protein